MLTLPKANPFRENIPVFKIAIPDVLKKLASESFTGYAEYTLQTFKAFCLFVAGKTICITSCSGNEPLSGFEALAAFFEQATEGNGELSIYRMTRDMAMCAHALLEGEHIYKSCEVRLTDIKSILGEMKERSLNGVVRFSAEDRHAMIFYKEGAPIGFYHDGASIIDSSPEESRKVAAMPGALLDIFATLPTEEIARYDLLHMINQDKLWSEGSTASTRNTPVSAAQPESPPTSAIIVEMIDDLQEVAVAYLSKAGRSVVEKCLRISGGAQIFLETAKIEAFLDLVRQNAMEIDEHARIDEMIELMRAEILKVASDTTSSQ